MADYDDCKIYIPPVRDVIDMIGSKWKLHIIIAVGCDIHRFNELERNIKGITPRMLSKELKDLELNRLIERVEISPYSNTFQYCLTEHGKSLKKVIYSLWSWGMDYRNKVMVKAEK
jgi:Predicted transcriptional regulators